MFDSFLQHALCVRRATGRSPAAQRGNEPRPQQQSTEQRGADGAQRTQGESTQQTPRRRATQLLTWDPGMWGPKVKQGETNECNQGEFIHIGIQGP